MEPVGTGIVFVVLVAIWVAYLVQYWSRRREHLATARSVEAFTEAMRVLERRPALRRPATGRASAYALSPARVVSARPQVIAKPRTAPTRPGGAPGMRLPTSLRPSPQSRPAKRPGMPAPTQGIRPSRKVRGLVLLGSLLGTLVVAGLAAFSVLLWWTPLIGVAAVVASFFWLRSGVQAEIRARRAARERARRRRPVPVMTAPGAVAASDEEVADLPVGREFELIEEQTVVASSSEGWSPVPVPPPTYTLKAKAEPRAARSVEAAGQFVEEPDIADLENPFAEPAASDQAPAAYGT